MTYAVTKDPVNDAGRSVAVKEDIVHFNIWVFGSNSHVPPPTQPSLDSSFLPAPP